VRHARHPRHRPYPHGHRKRGDDPWRAPVLDRPGPVPCAQREPFEPQQHAPQSCPQGFCHADRERHGGCGDLPVGAPRRRRGAGRGAGGDAAGP
jgi:hypothetical protein